MLEYGWIKVHRSLLKWEWYDDINTKTIFLHLLLTVNATDERWHGIEVKRGSRISSFAKLAAETKLSVDKVRTAIAHLESTGEITRSPHAKYTVFTIKNYDIYQEVPNSTPNNSQANPKLIPNSSQQSKKVKESIRKNKNITQCVCASENCENDTHNSSIPTPEQVAGMAAEIGAAWDADECRRFLDYNLGRNRESGWEQAVKLWESHRKPKRTVEDMDQATMEDYLSVVNRFKEG